MNIELVTVLVADYDQAVEFFVGVLQMELLRDDPIVDEHGQDRRWVVVRPRDAHTGLLLARADEYDRVRAMGRQSGGRVGFFLRVDDFAETYARLCEAGAEIVRAPRDEPYGRVAVFRDVAGNSWDLLGPVSS